LNCDSDNTSSRGAEPIGDAIMSVKNMLQAPKLQLTIRSQIHIFISNSFKPTDGFSKSLDIWLDDCTLV
jgi:hypothetical protein